MTLFRAFLVVQFLVVTIYTLIVVANVGPNLFPAAINGVQAMDWQGQFNLDFLTFVLLAGLWIAWRHNFTPLGIVLGLCIFGGMIYFAVYLLVISFQTNGDMKQILLGQERGNG